MKSKKDMFYTISDKLDTIENKLSSIADILELIAEHKTVDHISGPLWFIRDSMKELCEKIEEVSELSMENYLEK